MSKIIISDDQNTVEMDGKKYVAKMPGSFEHIMCSECDLNKREHCYDVPCDSLERKDKRNLIFKLQK